MFIKVYTHMAREMFNIFHTLTFASLVGNGIKFITAYQKYDLIKRRFNSDNLSTFIISKIIILLIFYINHLILKIYTRLYNLD